jgi:hypothetical protein
VELPIILEGLVVVEMMTTPPLLPAVKGAAETSIIMTARRVHLLQLLRPLPPKKKKKLPIITRPFNIIRTWNRPHGIASKGMWERTVSFRAVSPQDEWRETMMLLVALERGAALHKGKGVLIIVL